MFVAWHIARVRYGHDMAGSIRYPAITTKRCPLSGPRGHSTRILGDKIATFISFYLHFVSALLCIYIYTCTDIIDTGK